MLATRSTAVFHPLLLSELLSITGERPMKAIRYTLLACVLHYSTIATAQSVPLGDKEACMVGPMAQFGQYIGDWNIHDSQLGQETGEWADGAGARWNFVCLGNGSAVQDFWIPNDSDFVGTNLRTYNQESASWDIAWTIDPMPGFAHIQAKQQDDGSIVMHYKSPVPDPLRRITFFPPDKNGWRWTLEVSSDAGQHWTEVYRIKATRSH